MGELLSTVSSRELAEWRAFEVEHGPVQLRPDYPPALLAALLANIYRGKGEPREVADFLIGGTETFEQTPEQMAMVAEMTAALIQEGTP